MPRPKKARSGAAPTPAGAAETHHDLQQGIQLGPSAASHMNLPTEHRGGSQAQAGAGETANSGGSGWGTRSPPAAMESPFGGFASLDIASFGIAGLHAKRIFDLQFCPGNSSLLLSGSDDDTAAVWHQRVQGQQHWRQAATLSAHSDCVLRVAWGRQGDNVLATASADRTVAIWRLQADLLAGDESQRPVPAAVIRGHPEEVYACEFLEKAPCMLTASGEELFLWDLETSAILSRSSTGSVPGASWSLPGAEEPPDPTKGYVFGARESPGGSLVAAPCSDGQVRLWSLDSPGALQPLSVIKLHTTMGSCVAFDSQGQYLLSTSGDGTMAVVDIRMWRVAARHRAPTGLMGAAYLPSSGHTAAVAAGQDGNVWRFDCSQDGAFVDNSPLPGKNPLMSTLLCVAVSSDSKKIAYAGEALELPGGYTTAEALDSMLGVCSLGSSSDSVLVSNNPLNQVNQPSRSLIAIREERTL